MSKFWSWWCHRFNNFWKFLRCWQTCLSAPPWQQAPERCWIDCIALTLQSPFRPIFNGSDQGWTLTWNHVRSLEIMYVHLKWCTRTWPEKQNAAFWMHSTHFFAFWEKSRLPVTKDIHLEVMCDTVILQSWSVQHAMTLQAWNRLEGAISPRPL